MSALGRISDINLAEGAALAGGVWALPLTNMLDPLMVAKPARCADVGTLASSQFTMTLARPRALNLIGLLFHTMSLSARCRVTLNDGNGQVVNIPTWRDVHPRLFPTSSLDWEQENYWDGRPTGADLDLYPRNMWISFDAPLIAASVTIEINDQAHPDGAFDIGFIWAASTWSPAFNFERGRELSLEKRDRVEESLSGHQVGEYRRPRRMLRVSWADLQKDEVLRFTDIGMRSGTTRPVLFIPDFTDDPNLAREAFLATLETPPPARFNFGGRHSTEIVLKEIMR